MDGLALAWSTAEHLLAKRASVLFATVCAVVCVRLFFDAMCNDLIPSFFYICALVVCNSFDALGIGA